MDLNGDGSIDILSGSYSRFDGAMAGLFQVLHGNQDGQFGAASALNGTDDEPLILPTESDDIEQICTRPFACDLNGDGHLDIVAGNFEGTFGWFVGSGKGRFAPAARWLNVDGSRMRVSGHSDPFLVDWDADGDLDLLSGSDEGGAYLFSNSGSKTEPRFDQPITLLEPAGHDFESEPKFGDEHLVAPATATRVWASDVDGDGKLDLLIGDQLTTVALAEGVDEKTGREKLAEFEAEALQLFELLTEDSEEAREKFEAAYDKLETQKRAFVIEESTGFVWLIRQK